jgi:hypothetical protein
MNAEVEADDNAGVLGDDALTDDITTMIDDITGDSEILGVSTNNSLAPELDPAEMPESETTGVLDPETTGVTRKQ